MAFLSAGVGFGLLLIAAAVGSFYLLPRRPELWRSLPRERLAGSVLGLGCLVWSAVLVSPLLEGELGRLRPLLPVIVAVVAVGAFFYLDYLFTRALAGFVLLYSNLLMHQAFMIRAPVRPVLSAICYAGGIVALLLIAYPYLLRDFLQRGSQDRRVARGTAAALFMAGLASIGIAAASYGR